MGPICRVAGAVPRKGAINTHIVETNPTHASRAQVMPPAPLSSCEYCAGYGCWRCGWRGRLPSERPALPSVWTRNVCYARRLAVLVSPVPCEHAESFVYDGSESRVVPRWGYHRCR
jgi:hypothetical protein